MEESKQGAERIWNILSIGGVQILLKRYLIKSRKELSWLNHEIRDSIGNYKFGTACSDSDEFMQKLFHFTDFSFDTGTDIRIKL